MLADLFIDTNILVYAHDADAGNKHFTAKTLIEGLWTRREVPTLSVQVLQELHVNLIRKGMKVVESDKIVSRYLSWRVLDNTRRLFRQALVVQARWQMSFWDAHIVAAAQQAGVSTLWSEDLAVGQDYDGPRVTDPLLS